MLPAKTSPTANRLLAALPRKERQHLLAGCEEVDLAFATVLCEPGEPIRHVYFPADSSISVLTPIDGSASVEVGLVGNEGMLGIPLVLGVSAWALRGLVQGSGRAWRMNAASFRSALDASPALQRALNRYLYVLMAQLAQAAACTRFHVVETRLARLLLMTQDRAHPDHRRAQAIRGIASHPPCESTGWNFADENSTYSGRGSYLTIFLLRSAL